MGWWVGGREVYTGEVRVCVMGRPDHTSPRCTDDDECSTIGVAFTATRPLIMEEA